MKKWLGIGALFGLIIGLILWAMSPSQPEPRAMDEKPVSKREEPKQEHPKVERLPVKVVAEVYPDDEEDHGPKKELDIHSQEFFDKVDIVVQRKLYQNVTDRCFRDGLNKDQKIKFTYKLKSIKHEVSFFDIKVVA